jgi:2,5-dihydroxypyridine 5,6-dioxygenase
MIDLMLILFEPELEQIQAAGTRVVSCVEPPEVLARLLPDEDQRRRAEASLRLVQGASRIRITSAAGTDVTYELGDLAPFCQYGYSDEPGRWDHFPSTHVVHCGNEDGVGGRVVLKPGDVVLPFGRYVTDPITIEIERGFVASIVGGADALLLRDAMAAAGELDAYGISHIGWGLNERARWDALLVNPGSMGMDVRGYEGCVMFATGPNSEFGGSNHTPCHFDIPMRDCTVHVDDELVIDEGRIVHEAIARPGTLDSAAARL